MHLTGTFLDTNYFFVLEINTTESVLPLLYWTDTLLQFIFVLLKKILLTYTE